jgi:hypothetical protein
LSQVVIRVSPYALQEAFRLPGGVSLVSAGTERMYGSPPGRPDVLVLTLDFPGAPEGAVSADPVYNNNRGHAGWLQLEGFIWHAADGTEVARTWEGWLGELAEAARCMGTTITVLPPDGSDAAAIEIDGRPEAEAKREAAR